MFPHIELLKLKKNYGFSGGMNKGLKHLNEDPPDFVIFMNNDIIVSENFIDGLIDSINLKGNNNIFSPIIYYSADRQKIWYAGGLVKLAYGMIRHVNIRKKRNEFKINEIQSTDYITGCCMLISWELLHQLNGFNENFNMYGEDVDLCLRARKYGAKCYVIKKSIIWHKISQSIGGNYSWRKNIKKFSSIFKLIYFHSSKVVFFITGIFGLMLISIASIPKFLFRGLIEK